MGALTRLCVRLGTATTLIPAHLGRHGPQNGQTPDAALTPGAAVLPAPRLPLQQVLWEDGSIRGLHVRALPVKVTQPGIPGLRPALLQLSDL